MATILQNIQKAHKLLADYKGENPYLIQLKQKESLNTPNIEYILRNIDFEPVLINKTVKVASWWGEKKQTEWNTEFVPEKIKITWYLGDTSTHYVFYCIYRRSQISAVLCFAPKNAILTDFLTPDYRLLELDFKSLEPRSGRVLRDYQEDGVKFLVQQKKAILADLMGGGKTATAIVASILGKYEHILIVSPASLKKNWEKELSLYIEPSDITIVEGSKWKDAKYTIINYDILDNFYTIPTQKIKARELSSDEEGNLVTEYKEKEIVSRNKKIIDEAMAESQLFQSKFDLIIIDEAHKLSNTSSGRYKIMSDLIKRLNPKGIFELTGTPITNRPINFYNILKLIGCPLADDWKNYVLRYCDGKSFYNKKERDVISNAFIRKHHKTSWYDLSYSEKQELDGILEQRCKKIWVTDGASNLDELQEIIKPYYLRRDKEDFGKMPKKTVKLLKYELSPKQKNDYDKIWDEYIESNSENKSSDDLNKYKKITESTLLRQWVAHEMLEKTISLTRKCVEKGHKVVIFCAFDDEVNTLKTEFGDIAVTHNGKMNMQKKNQSVEAFQNNDKVKVFIGNLNSAGVGLTLIAGDVCVFNSFSYVSGDNEQCEDRIHRLNQTKDCTVYYQIFDGTFYEKMFNLVRGKQDVINKIIISEKEK